MTETKSKDHVQNTNHPYQKQSCIDDQKSLQNILTMTIQFKDQRTKIEQYRKDQEDHICLLFFVSWQLNQTYKQFTHHKQSDLNDYEAILLYPLTIKFHIYTKMNQQQHQIDIDEARMLLSMKDDEIRNMINQKKLLERKTNIRMKQLQYLIEQQKQKVIKEQKRYQKLMQLKNQEQVTLLSQITTLDNKILVLTQSHTNQIVIYCQQILNLKKLNEQLKKSRDQFQKSLKTIQEIFNLSAILGKQGILQIPNYLQIYRKYQQKKEEVQLLNRENQRLKSQNLLAFKQLFQKQNTAENFFENLQQQNEYNVKSNIERQLEISICLSQIQQKSEQLNIVKHQSHQQINQLRQQITNLQIQLKNYEETKYQLQEIRTKYQTYADIIGELKVRLESKQIQMEELITEYEQKLLNIENQNSQLHIQLLKTINNYQQQTNNFKSIIINLQNNLITKQQTIINLQTLHKQLQIISNKRKSQLQKYSQQLIQVKKASQTQENERKLKEELLQIRLRGLSQEIYILNQKLNISNSFHQSQDTEQNNNNVKNGQSSNKNKSRKQSATICPKSLLIDIGDKFQEERWDQANQTNIENSKTQVNWAQLYYNLLKRHNEFSKKIHFKLSKITKKCK